MSCPAGPTSQSQSLFRSYGSILPTSLTYIRLDPEAVHLGDLMRRSVRTGTGVLRRSLGFSRSARLSRNPAESTGLWRFLDAPVSLPPLGAIRGIGGASARTDNSAFRSTVSFPESRRLTARDLSVARHVDAPLSARPRERSVTRFPNHYGIPSRLWFARRRKFTRRLREPRSFPSA